MIRVKDKMVPMSTFDTEQKENKSPLVGSTNEIQQVGETECETFLEQPIKSVDESLLEYEEMPADTTELVDAPIDPPTLVVDVQKVEIDDTPKLTPLQLEVAAAYGMTASEYAGYLPENVPESNTVHFDSIVSGVADEKVVDVSQLTKTQLEIAAAYGMSATEYASYMNK